MEFIFQVDFWFAVLRSTTPVLFATLAALIASKSGILNIGIEGAMIMAALCGVVGSALTNNLLIGMLCGVLGGVIFTMILGYCVLKLKSNAVITGVALNLAASGGSVVALAAICGDKNASTSLRSLAFPEVSIPVIKDIPIIGEVLSGHNILTYLAIIAAILLYILLSKTSLGIKIRAVGESKEAAESVGINTQKVQFSALLMSGVLAAFGGMFLSMGYINMFTTGMVAGRGYIALATNAMSSSHPILSILSSALYGTGNAISIYVQNITIDTN